MKLAAAVLALVAVPLTAHAGHALEDSDEVLDQGLHWEGAFGMRVGSAPVGPATELTGVGLHVDGGVRLDRLYVYGDWAWLSLSNDAVADSMTRSTIAAMDVGGDSTPSSSASALSGSENRWGANARYSFAKLGGGTFPLRGDFWVEAGVGYERISWDGGGELSRPDLALGIGGGWSLWWGDHGARHHAGIFYALRVQLARRPGANPDAPATCAGPCDEATPPDTLDRSYMFNMGIVFGG